MTALNTYLFGYGSSWWTVESYHPELARIAIHEHVNPQAGEERPVIITEINGVKLEEEEIVYWPTRVERDRYVNCNYEKFCADNLEELREIIKTIKPWSDSKETSEGNA